MQNFHNEEVAYHHSIKNTSETNYAPNKMHVNTAN